MNIYNSTKNNIIAHEGKVAQNFITRSIGLLLKSEMVEDEFLTIRPCCSIHTFFMRFPIDVLFVNRRNEIVALYENVKPWKILPIHLTSSCVIELKSGQITKKNIEKGDLIALNKD